MTLKGSLERDLIDEKINLTYVGSVKRYSHRFFQFVLFYNLTIRVGKGSGRD